MGDDAGARRRRDGTSDPDDGLDGLSDDEFAATCVDLSAETIESVVLCVVGLDGSITEIADGLVPGRQIALSADRSLIAAVTADEVTIVSAAGKPVATRSAAGTTGLAWMPDGESIIVQTPTFSPDGSQLMYVEARGAVVYQDIDDEGSGRVGGRRLPWRRPRGVPGQPNLALTRSAIRPGDIVAMGHTYRRLLDDRTPVEVIRRVVGGGPDQLHAPVVCPAAVRVGADVLMIRCG